MNQIYSYCKTLAAAAFTLLAATACSESYEYVPDTETAGKSGQVFFGQDLPSTLKLTDETTEFSIAMKRANTQGDITVKLTSKQPEPAIYNIPQTVTFADGKAESSITVTVDPKNLEYDDMRTISISVDSAYSTPYGTSTYTVKVGKPAPWTEWCSTEDEFKAQGGKGEWPLGNVGKGVYTFSQMLKGQMGNIPVQFRQHKLNGDCQFRFVELATDYFPAWKQVVLDAKWREDLGVYILRLPKTTTGYIVPDYPGDPVFVIDILSFLETQGQNIPWDNWEQLKPEFQSWYNPSTGLFKIATYYGISLGSFGNGDETLQMDGFYVPDYSVEAQYMGIYTNQEGKVSAVGNATLGRDLTEARAIVMPQAVEVQGIIDAIMAQDAPSADLPWVALSQSGNFTTSFDPEMMGSEKLQLLVIGINEGKAISAATAKFEYFAGEKPWKSLGKGFFCDDIITTSYTKLEAPVYEVEIMEHKEKPGLYRVMNVFNADVHPYGKDFVANGAVMAPEGSALEINAEDPNGVYIATQSLGCTIDPSEGELAYCTYPYFVISQGQLTLEQAKAKGLLGVVKDGKILFPMFKTNDGMQFQGITLGSASSNNAWYTASSKGVIVVLPGAPAFEQNMARAKAKKTIRLIQKTDRVKYDSKKLHVNPLVRVATPLDVEL